MKYAFSELMFGWPLAILITGGIVAIFSSSLIPNDLFLNISYVLTLAIGTIFSVAAFFRLKQIKEKQSQLFLLVPVCYYFTYLTITFFVPLLLKPVFNTTEIIERKVIDKEHSYKMACYSIDVGYNIETFPTRVLCLNSSLWNRITVGNNVTIVGTKSPFGLYVDKIEILHANNAPQSTPKSSAAER